DCTDTSSGTCGPGGYCIDTQNAVPPVRLLEFTENFAPNSAHSICRPTLRAALEQAGNRLVSTMGPGCYPACAADSDPGTPQLEATCTVASVADQVRIELVECPKSDGSYLIDPETGDHQMPSQDTNICYALLGDDAGATSDPRDNLTSKCANRGSNLAIHIARRKGFPTRPNARFFAKCEASEAAAAECPGP